MARNLACLPSKVPREIKHIDLVKIILKDTNGNTTNESYHNSADIPNNKIIKERNYLVT